VGAVLEFPAGTFLHRVIPLHTEGLCDGTGCLPRPFKWSFFGETPTNLLSSWHFEAEASSSQEGAILGSDGIIVLEDLYLAPFEPI